MDIGVLTVFATAVAAWALLAVYRAISRLDDPNERVFRAVVAGVLSITAFASWSFEVAHHQRQQLATEALGVVSDVPGLSADCERFTEELFNIRQYQGYVYYDGSNVAHLRRNLCHSLWDYAHGGQANPSEDQILAVHVVAHEAEHINGVRGEAAAECSAVQLNHLIAEKLGATPEQARALQRRYFEDYYPNLYSDYVSHECRADGKLDIFPDRTEFP
jgi:hypothetical protein